MGYGATESKGSIGSRFRGRPDKLTLKDGTELDGVRILSAKLQDDSTVNVQNRVGGEWKDQTRGLFRGPDIQHGQETHRGRAVAFTRNLGLAFAGGRRAVVGGASLRAARISGARPRLRRILRLLRSGGRAGRCAWGTTVPAGAWGAEVEGLPSAQFGRI